MNRVTDLHIGNLGILEHGFRCLKGNGNWSFLLDVCLFYKNITLEVVVKDL